LPRKLSGGQQQRVAFARALAPNPRVLLLDEPFGALDAKVRLELREWLQRLHDETHVTTVMVTHDQDEALELSQHVVVMRDGRVEQAGSPHDLYDRPASPFVASFVGGASVLRGTVRDGRASIGSLSMAAPAGARDGESVEAYVRPHDVRIAPAGTDADPTAPSSSISTGRVLKMARVGGTVKVELRLSSGETLALQRPRAEIDALALSEGDSVLVDLASAKVVVEDYAI
jgi:sulfate transport system ATP-binding protein